MRNRNLAGLAAFLPSAVVTGELGGRIEHDWRKNGLRLRLERFRWHASLFEHYNLDRSKAPRQRCVAGKVTSVARFWHLADNRRQLFIQHVEFTRARLENPMEAKRCREISINGYPPRN